MNTIHSVVPLLALAAALAAQAGHQSAPEPLAQAFGEAQAMAKAQKAPVLAFVLPPASAPAEAAAVHATRAAESKVGMLGPMPVEVPVMTTARDVVLRRVQLLRAESRHGRGPGAPSKQQAIFALTVPVFATAPQCQAAVGETVVILGADGRRVRGFAVDLLDAAAFARVVGGVVLAPDALAPRQANVPPAILAELERMAALKAELARGEGGSSEALAALERCRAGLAPRLAAAAPAMVRVDGEQLVIDAELAALEPLRPPQGSKPEVLPGDNCIACGMAYTPPSLQTVLKLLGS